MNEHNTVVLTRALPEYGLEAYEVEFVSGECRRGERDHG